jgi:hypothetical protein
MVTILDGPMGTELAARGVPRPAPLWSARAVLHRPEVVSAARTRLTERSATSGWPGVGAPPPTPASDAFCAEAFLASAC